MLLLSVSLSVCVNGCARIIAPVASGLLADWFEQPVAFARF